MALFGVTIMEDTLSLPDLMCYKKKKKKNLQYPVEQFMIGYVLLRHKPKSSNRYLQTLQESAKSQGDMKKRRQKDCKKRC